MKSTLRTLVPSIALACGLTGCVSVGPKELRATQEDYARALGDAKKRQILATIVGLRFADPPAFLTASQIIVGYDFTASGGPTLATRPGAGGAALQSSGALTLAYSSHPTFTFTPATGDAYATFIRPLSPTLFLPLASSQTPIDVLLRVTTQSIGSLQNATMLGEPAGNGSPGFFELLAVLRRLQLSGALAVQYREVNKIGQVFLVFNADGHNADARDLARARQLLGVPETAAVLRVTYGDIDGQTDANSVHLTTRSVLGILGNLGAEVNVSGDDVTAGATKPTIQLVGGETRATIVVHSGMAAPADAYVAITYAGRQYWIERNDFDSKYAFSIVQDLMALAESGESSRPPVVTIPAS